MPKLTIEYPEIVAAAVRAGTKDRIKKIRKERKQGEWIRDKIEEAIEREEK